MMETRITSWGKAPSGRAGPTIAVLVATMVAALLVLFAFSQQPALAAVSPGQAWSWGEHSIGNNGYTIVTRPASVSGFEDVVDVGGGSSHSTWLKSDGTVWASGDNSHGQLGDGSFMDRRTPVQVSGLTNVIDVDNGPYHSLALKGDGTVWAWGSNSYGQLGGGASMDRHTTPVQVSGLTNVIDVEAGRTHSIALKTNGTVRVWGGLHRYASGERGDNYWGNCDNATSGLVLQAKTGAATYCDDLPLTNVVAIAAGGHHSLALKNDGTVWAWGDNSYGQLGNQGDGHYWGDGAVPVDGLTGVVDLAADGDGDDWGTHWGFSLALKGDGTVWAWGINNGGQLGDGTTTSREAPVKVSGLTGVTQIANGENHSLALKGDGTAWAWGSNADGQLGNGSYGHFQSNPLKVRGLSGVTYLEGGGTHSLAIAGVADTTKPTVKSTTPLANATGVDPGIPAVTATFSEKMQPATITGSTIKLFRVTSNGTTQVTDAAVSLSSDGLTATLDPFGTSSTQLAANAKYKVIVTTGAKDLAGNALDQNRTKRGNQQKAWTFTTGTG
jgi:alpha-tubulin suppressor-like RCC1 family protein